MGIASSSLLIEQNTPISAFQWDGIVRDLIMFSDKIWLHRSAVSFDSKLDIGVQRHFELAYNELIEAGLIHFYAFESDSKLEQNTANRVITREEHLELYNSIIERMQNPNTYTLDSLQDPERTSRIVEKRNELWKYGLATLLKSEISFTCSNFKNNISYEMSNRSVNSKLTNELFSAFDIPSLSHLNAAEIIELKAKAQKHKKVLQNLTIQARTNPNETITDVVTKEFDNAIEKINQLATDSAGNGAIKNLIINSTLNLGGLVPLSYIVLVPLTAVLCGKDMFEFLRSRKKYGFVLFMNSLKIKARNNPTR